MDFPSDAITNISAINGFSVIHWRIYTEEAAIGNLASEIAPTNGYNILRHLSRLKDLEIQLRNLDCLVSCYPRRLGLWIFSPSPGFENLLPLTRDSAVQGSRESTKLTLGASSLKVSASGSITAADLIRSLSADGLTPAGGTPGQSRAPGPGPRSGDTYAIYASFITAVAGAIGLQLTRRHNAIPLGTRTFFTALERSFYDNPTILNDDACSIPALTTLRIELVQTGKIIAALHTVYQDGISRLGGPDFTKISPANVQPNIDVWLAPNGTVARVITVDTTLSTAFAPKQAKNDVSARQITEAKQRVWKATVLEWMSNIGLPVDSSENEHWIEVEVSEPFYARLAADHLRKMDDGQSSSPLKRILWPSGYCFRRKKVSSSSYSDKLYSITTDSVDPLHFAENWLETATLRHEKPTDRSSKVPEVIKVSSISKSEVPEKIESLARVVHYPDLQGAGSVYPTPPDGAQVSGINPIGSDTLGTDGQEMALSHISDSAKQPEHVNEDSSGEAALQPRNELEVGTGLYDTNDDDGLFSDMNDRDFATKGITDADFNFFDDDEMDDFLADDPKTEHPQDIQHPSLADGAEIQFLQEDVKADQVAPKDDRIEQLREPHSPNKMEIESELKVDTQHPTAEPRNPTFKGPSSIILEEVMSTSLSPVDIKKILFSKDTKPSGDINKISRPSNSDFEKKQSRYNAISFRQDMSLSDQKYANAGRFFFMANKECDESTNLAPGIPTIGFPRGRKPGPRTISEEGSADARQSDSVQTVQRSASVSSDETSLDSSDDYSETETSPVRATTLKRKRPLSEAEKSTTSSMERLSITSEAESHVSKEDTSIFLGNFFSVFADWSLVGYFSARQSSTSSISSRKEDQMQVAQLVVDQFTQSSLCHNIDGWESVLDLENEAVNLHTCLEDVTAIGETEKLDLKTYVSLHDIQQAVIETPSTRPNLQRRDIKGSITKLPPAHLRIHRGRDFLEVLPTSMPFWETFGLAPASGQKDISAYCICPQFLGDEADAFLTRLEFLYSSCNLGLWNIANGDGAYVRTMQSLRSLCEGLGNALSKAPPIKENFVVYIINPFTHGTAFADICSTFLQLFHKYIGDVDKAYAKSQLNELVLQIVPLSFVFSSTSLVVPTQSQYLNLALEVYSRCPPKDANTGIVGYAPPVVLANAVPKAINFRVTSERFSPFQEGRCLHVAVSRSVDQRWISAAWSDNSGSCQITMSYCVRSRGSNVNRKVSEIRQEIWEATKDLMERTQTRWRVLLVRTEPIDQEEIDVWTGFAERYNQAKTLPVELTLFSANIAPGLCLELPAGQLHANAMNPMASTPATTPCGGVSSPDQIGVATPASGGFGSLSYNNTAVTPTDTPSGLIDPDSEAVLIDACEESWAIILSHRLSNSTYMTEYKPALVSGYLLRRKGANDSQGVAAMSLNLVHTSRPAAFHEVVLKEALINYRDLATLARAKGTLHVQHNTLPWHIATAVKGQELLSYIL
ncbi:hypothetical protein UA08_08385 [Talaromyces atroroseus]|uniref:Mediator of RNA polymerase II transcription subunit 13 n=1 Tax=Talaromyces atroroseus TaxID=1441469 RepID=A0A1Q5Q7P0_TALAT|nr:hypothetical protein UA08_08385 [Talaromyces atroroseus]OKL56226.1 hypothetical protein UA08_08385 [Talaromyces atroroseus]